MSNSVFSQLHQQQHLRDTKRMFCLMGLLLLVAVIGLCAGDIWLWPTQWWDETGRLFVGQLRLPRVLAVILVGAALAVSGATMQALFNNPLAEPGLLGVSNSAGVAVIFTVIIGGGLLPVWWLSSAAISGALLMTILLLLLAHQLTATRLLLMGIALGIVCSALMTWAFYFSSNMDLRQLMYWMMGSFSGIDWRQSGLILSLLPVLLWLICQGKILNLLALGDISARQLGLSLLLWRNILVVAIGWLVGVSVALAGAIGFVGLVVPHILRLWGMNDHKALLPACAVTGAIVLLVSDVISRLALLSAELPIGVVTASLGAPLFIWLLLRRGVSE